MWLCSYFGVYGVWVYTAAFGLALLWLFVLLIYGVRLSLLIVMVLFAIMWFGCYCLVCMWVCLCCVDLGYRLRVV